MKELKQAARQARDTYIAALESWRMQKNHTTKTRRDNAYAALAAAQQQLDEARATTAVTP